MVQIAAAIGRGARIIVFDEPTSSLTQHEAERLYELIGRLRHDGVTALYVSHRMEEIFRLCDAVTVLRDGRHVATQPIASLDRAATRADDDRTPARRILSGPRPGGARTGAAARRRAVEPTGLSRRLVQRAGRRSARRGGTGRRGALGGRAGAVRPRSAGNGANRRRRAAGADPASQRRHAARHRPRSGGSQAAGPGAVDVGRQQHHARDPAAAGAPALHPARAPSARWRAATSNGFACGRPARTRRPPASPAATSRRWCWRSGWRRAAGC